MVKVEVPRKREKRRILVELSSYFAEDLSGENLIVRDVGAKGKDAIFLDGDLVGIRDKSPGDMVYPSIKAILEKGTRDEISVTVDQGAVPYVCNGADIMVPGVVAVGADVVKGGFVVIDEEKHGGVLAVGIALSEGEKIKRAGKGKAVKNLHWVGDPIWVAGK